MEASGFHSLCLVALLPSSHLPSPQKRTSQPAVRRIPPAAATSCSHSPSHPRTLTLSPALPPLSPSHSQPWASDGLGTVFITTDVATHPPVFPPPLPPLVLTTRTRPLASVFNFARHDNCTPPVAAPKWLAPPLRPPKAPRTSRLRCLLAGLLNGTGRAKNTTSCPSRPAFRNGRRPPSRPPAVPPRKPPSIRTACPAIKSSSHIPTAPRRSSTPTDAWSRSCRPRRPEVSRARLGREVLV